MVDYTTTVPGSSLHVYSLRNCRYPGHANTYRFLRSAFCCGQNGVLRQSKTPTRGVTEDFDKLTGFENERGCLFRIRGLGAAQCTQYGLRVLGKLAGRCRDKFFELAGDICGWDLRQLSQNFEKISSKFWKRFLEILFKILWSVNIVTNFTKYLEKFIKILPKINSKFSKISQNYLYLLRLKKNFNICTNTRKNLPKMWHFFSQTSKFCLHKSRLWGSIPRRQT